MYAGLPASAIGSHAATASVGILGFTDMHGGRPVRIELPRGYGCETRMGPHSGSTFNNDSELSRLDQLRMALCKACRMELFQTSSLAWATCFSQPAHVHIVYWIFLPAAVRYGYF